MQSILVCWLLCVLVSVRVFAGLFFLCVMHRPQQRSLDTVTRQFVCFFINDEKRRK